MAQIQHCCWCLPNPRRYAAHLAAGMMGHVLAWEKAVSQELDYAWFLEDDAQRTPSFNAPLFSELLAEIAAFDPEWDILLMAEDPFTKFDFAVNPKHVPEISVAEMAASPRAVTKHWLRVAPALKAVAWVLSRSFLQRLVARIHDSPFFGPVDVWAWRVRRLDGGAVRAYAPMMPWVEEKRACVSHSAMKSTTNNTSAMEQGTRGQCPDGLPTVVQEACRQLGLA
eukprot:4010920-Pleurochrysis_carterae.AAC.1